VAVAMAMVGGCQWGPSTLGAGDRWVGYMGVGVERAAVWGQGSGEGQWGV